MYSIVLMMAMTSGGDVADFGHHHGGCCGGESYSSCCGGGESYSCCGGGGLFGHHHHHSGSSCCGGGYSGCCGGGYSGCCGGGYSGCGGGYSGCTGVADCGCGAPVNAGCTGGVVTGAPVVGGREEPVGPGHETNKADEMTPEEQKELLELQAGNPDKKADLEAYFKTHNHAERKQLYLDHKDDGKEKKDDGKDKKDDGKDKKDDGKDKTMISAPATIIVSLPANATLTIDDAATVSTETTRVFTSPALPAGRDFHYTLKAQIIRDGKAVVVSKEVSVRAGETTLANLEASLANVASR